jgi:hypothetical protein
MSDPSDATTAEIERLRQRVAWADESILALADAIQALAGATLDTGPLGADVSTANEIANALARIRQTRPRDD